MKRYVLILMSLVFIFISNAQADNDYFDWPIPVESYNPYSFTSPSYPNGRALGTTDHTGEDVALAAGTSITAVGDGIIKRYKKNGSCSGCEYCGYGMLYAVIHHSLSREIKVPIGVNTFTTTDDFSFVYGHISNYESFPDTNSQYTEIIINDSYRTIPIVSSQTIGFIAPDSPDGTNCHVLNYNGDGAEHLHLGVVSGLIGEPYLIGGYGDETGKLPAHLVIAASRIGVFAADSTHSEPYWDSVKSQPFIDKWWEEYANASERGSDTDNYKYMELNNYHNKLGRSHDNGGGTDFVHKWASNTDSRFRVYIQDMKQPYDTDENGNNLSKFGSGHTALILNEWEGENKVYLLKEGFQDKYTNNNGPYAYGMPFTDEQTAPYANSPYNETGDFISYSGDVTVQKFRRVWEESGQLQYNNERRTLVKNHTTDEVRHYPISEFSIGTDVFPAGSQIYVINPDYPYSASEDIPWPQAGVTTPTGKWFAKPGQYDFVIHDAQGNRIGGYGLTAVLTEGNLQFVGDLPPDDNDPNNLNVAGVSENSIVLSITLPTNVSQYDQTIVYRSGAYFTTINSVSEEFTVSGLDSGTQYCLAVSLGNSGTGVKFDLNNISTRF